MFTGLVEAMGRLSQHREGRLVIDCPAIAPELSLGESVAVNGICLTVARLQGPQASFDYAAATKANTTITRWKQGDRLNLERALRMGDRLGGHLVQGHVDGVGEVVGIEMGDGVRFRVRLPADLLRYVVLRGSLSLDGVSLTVASLEEGVVSCVLVPHTWAHVALGDRQLGEGVNVEVDVLAKHVEKLLAPQGVGGSSAKEAGISLARLAEWGYA